MEYLATLSTGQVFLVDDPDDGETLKSVIDKGQEVRVTFGAFPIGLRGSFGPYQVIDNNEVVSIATIPTNFDRSRL